MITFLYFPFRAKVFPEYYLCSLCVPKKLKDGQYRKTINIFCYIFRSFWFNAYSTQNLNLLVEMKITKVRNRKNKTFIYKERGKQNARIVHKTLKSFFINDIMRSLRV